MSLEQTLRWRGMKDAASKTSRLAGEQTDVEDVDELERWLRCVSCGARVTREALRTSVNGKHRHEFMNPSGLRFVVACYSAAPGAVGDGERSTVWTWFPGFAWEIEVCRSCHAHLGWSFHAADKASFYGLVHDRVV